MPRISSIIAFALIGLIIGCASAEKNRTQDTEQLLSAAGFKPHLADNEAKMAHLASLPQHKVIPQSHEGKLFYVYADDSICNCLFVGDDIAYQEYSKLAVRDRIAHEQQEAAAMNQDAVMNAEMDWQLWGGLYPWD